MEAGHDRYSSPTSEHELDTGPNPVNDDGAATGPGTVTSTVTPRSYDCMYCKRGFTTAQALGGHMNIHRRDRARTVVGGTSGAATREFTPTSTSPLHHATTPVSMAPVVVHGDMLPAYHLIAGVRPFFTAVSEPAFPVYHNLPSSSPSTPPSSNLREDHRKREGKEEMDPEKLKELIRYGKDLELGLKKSSLGDIDDAEEDGKGKEEASGKIDLRLSL